MNPNVLLFQNQIPKCPICLGYLVNPVKSTKCSHIFCNICLSMWLQRKSQCPLCRANIEEIVEIYLPENSKSKNNKLNHLYYSIENLKIDNCNKYVRNCLVCGKVNPENDLILCDCCNYFETHLNCDPPIGLAFGKYYCRFCRKKFIDSLKPKK